MANLWLLFCAGKERYAIKAVSVVEVIPRINLDSMHQPQPYVIGQFNYQGQLVPVIDLGQLLGGTESQAVLSTRIVLVDLASAISTDQVQKQFLKNQLLGLMVEQVTDTISHEQTTPIASGVAISQADYLGEQLLYNNDVIQCLRLEQLLERYRLPLNVRPMEMTNAAADSTSS